MQQYSSITWGNFLAGVGRSWDDSPEGYANIHIHAPYTHDYFREMMIYKDPKTNKIPQTLLNSE
jgi:hypothetical protein